MWWDSGAKAIETAWRAWLDAFTAAGGEFDGIMLDMETGEFICE